MHMQPIARRTFTLAVVALAALELSLTGCGEQNATKTLGLVVTSIDNPYFVEMINGAKAAATQSPGTSINVQAPERGAVDPERQQQLIETLIAGKVNVLLIVPADSTQVIPSIQSANRAHIPVIILDNDINREVARQRDAHIAAFIGSDNREGGRLAGDFLKTRLGPGGGPVAILEGVAGVQAATDRKTGFLQAIAEQPSIHVVASQAADWDREKAYAATKAIALAHPELRAIFGANDEMALGAARALADAQRTDVIVVGYDATPDGRSAVAGGTIAATIAQQPARVGALGIELALKLLKGEAVSERTSVPLQVITKK